MIAGIGSIGGGKSRFRPARAIAAPGVVATDFGGRLLDFASEPAIEESRGMVGKMTTAFAEAAAEPLNSLIAVLRSRTSSDSGLSRSLENRGRLFVGFGASRPGIPRRICPDSNFSSAMRYSRGKGNENFKSDCPGIGAGNAPAERIAAFSCGKAKAAGAPTLVKRGKIRA